MHFNAKEKTMKTISRILALLLAALMALSVFAMAGCSEDTSNDGSDKNTVNETKKEDTKKETPSFSEFYGTDWINAAEFGMVGDGKTLNDVKFREYTKYFDDTPLYFPPGTYCFAETLNFPDRIYVHMDPQAELKCVAEEPLDYFITLRGQEMDLEDNWCSFLDYAHQSGIHGGIINANYKAKCALGISHALHTTFEDFMIMNVLEKGIVTNIAATPNSASSYENIYIYNDKSLPGTYGIYDNIADSMFESCTVVNFNTGYYTGGGRFIHCSAWNIDMANIETLTYAEIVGSQSVWIEPSVDTVRYGFVLRDGASTSISDLVYINNLVMYTAEMVKQYPRVLFVADNPEEAQFMVTGLQLRWEENLAFSNAPLPKSTFLNVRVPDGCDGSGTFKYFRDDSAYLREWIREAERDKGNFTATGKNDFNELTEPGIYECALASGKGGATLPPVKEKGMLEVSVTNGRILQRFYGETYSAYRFFNGAKWGDWIINK